MRPSAYRLNKKTIIYYQSLKKITSFLKKNIFLIASTIAVWTFFYDQMVQWDGFYADADGYTRALRTYHWLLAPSFMEQPLYESNYPFGEILHWTRPMDIIWGIFTLPFLYMPNLKDTIFISGAFIAPCLGILSALALTYGLRRSFNIYLTLIGLILFFYDQNLWHIFSPARPDHHALMLFLFIYCLSLTLCWLKKRQNRYLYWLGFSLALSTFTEIEGILYYILFTSFFLYLYVFKNISLTSAIKISKVFALLLTVFWLLNPPASGWFAADNNRISVLFVAAAWLAYIGLLILDISKIHTPRLKLLSLWSMLLGFSLILMTVFGPQIFDSPVDKGLKIIFLKRIAEFQTIFDVPLEVFLNNWLFALLAIALNFYMVKKSPYQRLMILNLCLAFPLFILSLLAIRFTIFMPVYTILPILALIDMLYKKSPYAQNKNLSFPAYIYAVILLVIITKISFYIPQPTKTNTEQSIYMPQVFAQVKNNGGTLLTDIFISPRYVWQSEVNTVGTCYHNNKEGILDTHKFFFATTPGEAIPLILKHQVSQILLFDSYATDYYQITDENKNKLYYRLLKRQNIPPFLEEIKGLPKQVRLYRVKI